MPKGLRPGAHGLRKLRVGHVGPLAFGTLSEETSPLPDYIGNLIGSCIHRALYGTPEMLGAVSQIPGDN